MNGISNTGVVALECFTTVAAKNAYDPASDITQTKAYVVVLCAEDLSCELWTDIGFMWQKYEHGDNNFTFALDSSGNLVMHTQSRDSDGAPTDYAVDANYMSNAYFLGNFGLVETFLSKGNTYTPTVDEVMQFVLTEGYIREPAIMNDSADALDIADSVEFIAKALLAKGSALDFGIYDNLVSSNGSYKFKDAVQVIRRLRENEVPLHNGSVGEIVEWAGAEYGLTKPDNLHPCDGTVINHHRAHANLKGQTAPNYIGRTTIGSGAGYIAGANWGANTQSIGVGNLPEFKVNIAEKTYSISGTTDSNSAADLDNHVWTFDPDNQNSPWELGSGINGDTHYYPRVFASNPDTHTEDWKHTHSFSASVTIDGYSKTYGSSNVQPLSVMQASTVVDKYIVIY